MICTMWASRSPDDVGEGISAEAVWNDPLMVAVPAASFAQAQTNPVE